MDARAVRRKTAAGTAIKLAKRAGGLTAREARAAGLHTQVLTRLVFDGRLERVGRGVYRAAGKQPSENHALVVVAAAAPKGVICLLSALAYHGVGTQVPADVWLAIDRRARAPRLDRPPLQVVRVSAPALEVGVAVERIEGRPVRMTSVARTVADCFKFRSRVGLDVALEALRDGWRARRFTLQELDRCAVACRVQRVMRPYIEAIVS